MGIARTTRIYKNKSEHVMDIGEGSVNGVRIKDVLLRLDSLDEEFADNLETQINNQEKID